MGQTWTSNNSNLSHRDNDHDHRDNLDDEGSGAPASVGVDPSGGAPTEEVLASWRKSLEQVIFLIIIIITIIIIILIIYHHHHHHHYHDHCNHISSDVIVMMTVLKMIRF